MNFQQILDVAATITGWSVFAVAIWWFVKYYRTDEVGPRWFPWLLYVGQVILTADAWIDPDSKWWAKAIITTGLVILTGLHLCAAYARWECRERGKAYAKLADDRTETETDER